MGSREKVRWWKFNIEMFFDEYGWLLVFPIFVAIPFFVITCGNKQQEEEQVVEQVADPDYHMIYFLDSQGNCFDSVKVEYYDFRDAPQQVKWKKNELWNVYSGSYMIKDLEHDNP